MCLKTKYDKALLPFSFSDSKSYYRILEFSIFSLSAFIASKECAPPPSFVRANLWFMNEQTFVVKQQSTHICHKECFHLYSLLTEKAIKSMKSSWKMNKSRRKVNEHVWKVSRNVRKVTKSESRNGNHQKSEEVASWQKSYSPEGNAPKSIDRSHQNSQKSSSLWMQLDYLHT